MGLSPQHSWKNANSIAWNRKENFLSFIFCIFKKHTRIKNEKDSSHDRQRKSNPAEVVVHHLHMQLSYAMFYQKKKKKLSYAMENRFWPQLLGNSSPFKNTHNSNLWFPTSISCLFINTFTIVWQIGISCIWRFISHIRFLIWYKSSHDLTH